MHSTLSTPVTDRAATALSEVNTRRDARYPGDSGARQPAHTCYVPADRFDEHTPRRWGDAATAALEEHAPGAQDLAELLGLPAEHAEPIHDRVRRKLAEEPIEDLRIDFEDGYGTRADDVEDAHAEHAGRVLGAWYREGAGTAYAGLRCKSFDTQALFARGLRTLDICVTTLVGHAGTLPDGFVLTFPKVTDVGQIEILVELLGELEHGLGLPEGSLRFEIQVETTQSILDSSGRFSLPRFIEAGRGRVSGLHFGTYDYTAACGLPATAQHLAHGACDFARHAMQVAAAGTGVRCSDGSTNVLPVGDSEAVRHGWRTHYGLVCRGIEHGFYQGWDMHPAQLVSRFAAVYACCLETARDDAERLSAYLHQRGGAVLDEPATARALAGSVLRGVDCGALDTAQLEQAVGTEVAELRRLARR